jgi:hypothetical protein
MSYRNADLFGLGLLGVHNMMKYNTRMYERNLFYHLPTKLRLSSNRNIAMEFVQAHTKGSAEKGRKEKGFIFWDTMPNSQVKLNRRFEGACRLYLHGRIALLVSWFMLVPFMAYTSTLKMKTMLG